MDIGQNLSVQSYCFREFTDNAKVAQMIRDCGMNGVELFGCGIHGDYEDPANFAETCELYKAAGVAPVALGVPCFAGDEAKERKFFESAKAAGFSYMSCSFDIHKTPDCFRVAEKLTEEFDMHVAIHNHGGYDWLGNTEALKWVFNQTSDRIGLCLDTAWAMAASIDPQSMAETFVDRLYGLHIKDFVFDRAGKPEDVVVGTGNLDLRTLINFLKGLNTLGWVALEYEGDADNPVPALTKCVEAVRALC
jgi:sugar phosphate isomerase/epimerase